ncbi:MAG: terminase small subunit [Kiloniellaceae bacterium]
MRDLTPRQRAFCEEFLIDLNASAAARRAGYSANGAGVTGCQLLANPKIAARVAELQEERSARVQVDADYVLKRLHEVAERCLQHVTPALGRDGEQLKDQDGRPLFRFDANGANRALELIGRHVAVSAWEPIKIEGQVSLVDRLMQARHQVSNSIDAEFSEVEPKRIADRKDIQK